MNEIEDNSSIHDDTDLSTLIGPNGEFEKVVRDCFTNEKYGNLKWKLAKTSTMEDFLTEYSAGVPILRSNLQGWIAHYRLENRFRQNKGSQQEQQQQEQERLERILRSTEFNPSSIHPKTEFEHSGFGPFVVKRESLVHQIVKQAKPGVSVHISGCKGSGKTILLNLIGTHLVEIAREKVYYISMATRLNDRDWAEIVDKLIHENRKAYFLVDETQMVVNSIPHALFELLKSFNSHQLTVIGAGVLEFNTLCASFTFQHRTHELFLSEEDLVAEGIVKYFDDTTKGVTILKHIRNHCSGHIFPLMRGMELLKKTSNHRTMTAEEVISYYESPDFRHTTEYKKICARILPKVLHDEMRSLFYSSSGTGALQKKGFVSRTGRVYSPLLLEAYFATLHLSDNPISDLRGGLDGIVQILQYSLPGLQWSHCDAHGGPVEDALSFELLSAMANIPQLTTRLFNPKFVDVGRGGRRPHIYINSQVNSYIECLLTGGHTDKDKKSLDEHIGRFLNNREGNSQVRYQLPHGREWAVLNFQKTGEIPLEPSNDFTILFNERVFTFLLATRKIYRGNTLLEHSGGEDHGCRHKRVRV